MATDLVAQLADSLAKTVVEEKELSYKGQGRKLDDAHSGELLQLFTHHAHIYLKLYSDLSSTVSILVKV